MTQRSFFYVLLLASCFVLVSPYGGSLDLASLDSSQGITLAGVSGSKTGTSIASCDFNGDGTKDTIIGAPGDTADGKVIVIFSGISFEGIDLSNPAKSGSGFVISYSALDGFGTQVVCLGDIDNDKNEDIAIGFTATDNIFVIYGSPSYNADFDLTSVPTSTYSVLSSSLSESLVSIAGLGDTTGDKKGDFIVSLYDGSKYSAAVVYGTIGSTFDLGTSVASTSFRISNGAQKDQMTVASAGLFNNDGLYDFAVGNLNSGAQVAIIFGQSGGSYSDMDFSSETYSLPQVLFVNADISYGLGASMTYAGDFDDDGYGDLLIGAPMYNSNSGAAYIIRGSKSFTTDISITDIPSSGGGYQIIHGTNSGLYVGSTVFGSLTSDTSNVAVCDASTNCYIIFGTATPSTIDLDAMESEDGFPIFSSSVSVTNPMQIIAIEDTNSDDYGDFVIGQGMAGDGMVYLVFGPNKCFSPCKTCSASDWTICQSCESGFDFLYNDFCYSSCPSHSYQDSKTTCASCDSNCLECSGSATTCTSCDTGSKESLFYDSACYETCPSGSYQDSSLTCASCNSHCLECSTTAKICTSCNNRGSYPLFYNDYCYGACPSHSYQDSRFTCAVCDNNCLNCEGSATICTSCDSSSSFPFLYNSACSSSCPETAPYSYLAACYTQCPTDTAPDSNNACILIVPEVPQAVQTLSTADVTRQVSNEIMSTISSLTIRGFHSIRSQTIQGPVSYFIFLNIAYPSNYGQFASANFGTSRLPNPFRYTGRSVGGRASSINAYLTNQSLLANIGYSIIFLLVCILLIPINDTALVLVEKHKKGYQVKWYYQFLKWSSVSLRWSFLINQFVSRYEDLAFFSFLGVYNAGTDNEQDTLNLIVCIFGFLITVAGLVGVFFIIKTVTNKLESFSEEEKEKEEYTKNDFLGRRLVLYKDLKKDQFMTMLYPFFLMIRVFGFSFVTVFLCNQTAVQLVFLNLYAVLMFAYLLKYRPLEEMGQFWMTMAYEIDAFIALFGVTVLAIYDAAGGANENTRTRFGYLIIAANIGMLILNFISFSLEIWEYITFTYKKLKLLYHKLTKKNKVTPAQIQSQDASFISPTSSFTKGKEFRLEGTPSKMPEGQGFLHKDSPELVSPNMMGEVKLSPFSSCIESGSTNERSSLIKIESSIDLKRSPIRKRLTQVRTSTILPVEEIPETEL